VVAAGGRAIGGARGWGRGREVDGVARLGGRDGGWEGG